MDKETRLRKLKEARDILMEVREDLAHDEQTPQEPMIHLRIATNEIHRARSELGMWEKVGAWAREERE